nr:hypothetical protein B0A51_11433 [Rachicladosporium sp. CCFEE 5018]
MSTPVDQYKVYPSQDLLLRTPSNEWIIFAWSQSDTSCHEIMQPKVASLRQLATPISVSPGYTSSFSTGSDSPHTTAWGNRGSGG